MKTLHTTPTYFQSNRRVTYLCIMSCGVLAYDQHVLLSIHNLAVMLASLAPNHSVHTTAVGVPAVSAARSARADVRLFAH